MENILFGKSFIYLIKMYKYFKYKNKREKTCYMHKLWNNLRFDENAVMNFIFTYGDKKYLIKKVQLDEEIHLTAKALLAAPNLNKQLRKIRKQLNDYFQTYRPWMVM